MAFRFQRRITVLPGIRLNLGKRGVSVSAGIRGASITAGKRGVYGNVGAPGTGLSYRTRLDKQTAHQRRVQRTQQRTEAAMSSTIRLHCDERGKLLMFDSHNNPLPASEVRQLRQQHGAQIQAFLQQELERINDDQELLVNIHHDTPSLQTPPPEFEQQAFHQAKPTEPELPSLPSTPKLTIQRFWHRWFATLEQRRTAHNERLSQAYMEKLNSSEKRRAQLTAEYEVVLKHWQAACQQHTDAQQQLAAAFTHDLHHDQEFMSAILESELAELDWPRETHIDFELRQQQQYFVLHIDVDLPTAEQFPSQEARFNDSRTRLLVKKKSATQQRIDYAQHVHGIVVRILGVAFVTLPSIHAVQIAAYTQAINPATGHEVDDYLLALTCARTEWQQLNLEKPELIDPIAALGQFKLQRNMSKTGIFQPISL